MGLLSAPFRGLLWICEELAAHADQELYDEDAITSRLADLYRKLEGGLISEEEHERREAELVQLLEEIEQRRQQRSHHEDH
jgi:argininosuccinate lyase